ncbi:hypothetical protein [Legionella clemsonensis]|uniref:Uncharacterized protein n=1 Tax=Legionella clemsonensis TaxID=1867846 RepID=A0A222P1S6_9GAMM|nr:hypothetical protein [Legionella clemsonensis]ASQ45790.1 hypothetical protein clem_06175 [Legionella clemsonensis]
MPKVKVITGNYREVCNKLFSKVAADGFCAGSSFQEAGDEILKDIPRGYFVSSNGRTHKDLMSTWINPKVSKAYSQGNINASFFLLPFQNFLTSVENEPYLEEIKKSKQLNMESYFFMDRKNLKEINFAFYDDEGIPCGVFFIYSTLAPQLWSAAIIRNTPAAPEEREVLFMSAEKIIKHPGDKVVNGGEANKLFLSFLRSKKIKNIFAGIINNNGAVNNANPELLKDITHLHLCQADIDEKTRQLRILKDKKLSAKQFKVCRLLLQEKQKKNIEITNNWVHSWKEEHSYPELDQAASQSFWQRNIGKITVGAVAVLATIGLILTLTGVLAPLGIALGGVAAILGIVGASIAGVTAVTSAIKTVLDEKKLADYQAEIKSIEFTGQKKIQEVSEKMDFANNSEQIAHAILFADFSAEEFDTLMQQLEKAETVLEEDLPSDFQKQVQELETVVGFPEVATVAEQLISSIPSSPKDIMEKSQPTTNLNGTITEDVVSTGLESK